MPRASVLLRTAGERGWLAFAKPSRILEARTAAAVADTLREAQRAVRESGCWAAGFVAYEAAGAFGLPVAAPTRADPLPLLWFGLYPAAHVTRRERIEPDGDYATGPWRPSISEPAYRTAIRRIKSRIADGDTYQINFTFRLTSPFRGDPIGLLDDLDRAQRGRWAGYVDTGSHVVCSASPELFYRLEGSRLHCRPMKGTAARGRWSDEDRRHARALRLSEKDRAENVMVVDMTRHDLGRIARIGSVRVPSLFDVERYPGQWQMTSTVAAETMTMDVVEIFESLFPSGSVTGAPKRSSMAIIRGLEAGPRGVYTGAVGCLAPDGRVQFNVAIRTVTIDRRRNEAEFGVGSGVVWDSDEAAEYAECLNKAAMLTRRRAPFRLIETLRWSPADGFVRLDAHLARLRQSAAYFGFERPDESRLRARLAETVRGRVQDARVRMLAGADAVIEIQVEPLAPVPNPMRVAIAAEPVSSRDAFLFHKTTNRGVYERARAARPGADAVLLWNERGEMTEATEANVVFEIDGRRVTPSLDCGALPGVLRAALVETGELTEAIVRRDAIGGARIWLISSLRGWVPAVLAEAPGPPPAEALDQSRSR